MKFVHLSNHADDRSIVLDLSMVKKYISLESGAMQLLLELASRGTPDNDGMIELTGVDFERIARKRDSSTFSTIAACVSLVSDGILIGPVGNIIAIGQHFLRYSRPSKERRNEQGICLYRDFALWLSDLPPIELNLLLYIMKRIHDDSRIIDTFRTIPWNETCVMFSDEYSVAYVDVVKALDVLVCDRRYLFDVGEDNVAINPYLAGFDAPNEILRQRGLFSRVEQAYFDECFCDELIEQRSFDTGKRKYMIDTLSDSIRAEYEDIEFDDDSQRATTEKEEPSVEFLDMMYKSIKEYADACKKSGDVDLVDLPYKDDGIIMNADVYEAVAELDMIDWYEMFSLIEEHGFSTYNDTYLARRTVMLPGDALDNYRGDPYGYEKLEKLIEKELLVYDRDKNICFVNPHLVSKGRPSTVLCICEAGGMDEESTYTLKKTVTGKEKYVKLFWNDELRLSKLQGQDMIIFLSLVSATFDVQEEDGWMVEPSLSLDDAYVRVAEKASTTAVEVENCIDRLLSAGYIYAITRGSVAINPYVIGFGNNDRIVKQREIFDYITPGR